MKEKKKSLDEMMAAILDRTPSLHDMAPEPYTESELEIIRRYNKLEERRKLWENVKAYILKHLWHIIGVVVAILSLIVIIMQKNKNV